MHKKPRLSIIIQIAIVFILAMSLSFCAGLLFGRHYLMKRAVEVNMYTANDLANLVRYYLEPLMPIDSLSDEHKAQTRTLFREFCINFDYKYVYLYMPSEDGTLTYYFSAAQDDAMDEEIQRIRPYGSTIKRDLFKDEESILKGEEDEGYEFVDDRYGNVCEFMFALKDQDGNLCGIIGIDDDISDVRKDLAREQSTLLVLMLVYFLVAILVSLVLIKRFVILPIDNLSKRMRRFIEDKDAGTTEVKTIFADEVTDIHDSFNKMAGDITAYVKDLKELTTEKARNETQIEVARKIQRDIVPPDYSLTGNGCDIFCVEKPAKAVGGDFYDVFYISEREICVTVGDISGKGISAALFMVMVKTNLRNYVKTGESLSDVLRRVNREVCASNSQDMFATVFLSVLNTETGVLRYANAGHEQPLVICNEPYYLTPDTGMALGLFEDAAFKEEECTLKDGQGILVYTDGVAESINTGKEQYGMDRIKETVHGLSASCNRFEPEEAVNAVIDSVTNFSKDMEQFDDITCVTLIYRNNEEDRLHLKPDMASFEIVKEKMIEVLGNTEESRNMIMACEEMFCNIVNYSGTDSISVVFRRVYDLFSIELVDSGVPFDPINAVIRNKDFLELDTGGMGIKLARLNSKEMVYNRMYGRNHLIMKFEIPS